MIEMLFTISQNRWIIMIMINIILLFLGCFMESASIMIITVPIFVPIITKLGFDPIYFGVLLTLNIMIGTLTRPSGSSSISRLTLPSCPYQRPSGRSFRSTFP